MKASWARATLRLVDAQGRRTSATRLDTILRYAAGLLATCEGAVGGWWRIRRRVGLATTCATPVPLVAPEPPVPESEPPLPGTVPPSLLHPAKPSEQTKVSHLIMADP